MINLSAESNDFNLASNADSLNANVVCGASSFPVNEGAETDNTITLYGELNGCSVELTDVGIDGEVYTGSLPAATATAGTIFTSGGGNKLFVKLISGNADLTGQEDTTVSLTYQFEQTVIGDATVDGSLEITNSTVGASGELAPDYVVSSTRLHSTDPVTPVLEITVTCTTCVSDIEYAISTSIPGTIDTAFLNGLTYTAGPANTSPFSVSYTAAELGLSSFNEMKTSNYVFSLRRADGIDTFSYATLNPGALAPKVIFVSTSTYQGNLGGISGADAKCNGDAKAVAGKTYKALLSGGGRTAVSGIGNGAGGFVRHSDSTEIAGSLTELFDGSIAMPTQVSQHRFGLVARQLERPAQGIVMAGLNR